MGERLKSGKIPQIKSLPREGLRAQVGSGQRDQYVRCGEDVVHRVVGRGVRRMQRGGDGPQLVVIQVFQEPAAEVEGIVKRMVKRPLDALTEQVPGCDRHVKPNVVPHNHTALCKIQKRMERIGRRLPMCGEPGVRKAVYLLRIANRLSRAQEPFKPLGNRTVRGEPDSRHLDDLVLKDVGSGRLHVEHHHPSGFERL